MACSTPPIYWLIGNQSLIISLSNGKFLLFESRNLRKYQDESTKVSIVSVSLILSIPQVGQGVLTNSLLFANGESSEFL